MEQPDVTLAHLAELFRETAEAHQHARAASAEADADWPIWYAKYLVKPLNAALRAAFTECELVALLQDADDDRRARASATDSHLFFAEFFAERFVPSARQETLALYHFDACPFCQRVRRVIDELGLQVELRDIWENPAHRDDLMAARGRTTVPVLRCTSADKDRWLPESRDIIRHLRSQYG